MVHRVVVIRGNNARTLDWSDDSLGEMTGSARRIVTNFVIGVLSESEAARDAHHRGIYSSDCASHSSDERHQVVSRFEKQG